MTALWRQLLCVAKGLIVQFGRYLTTKDVRVIRGAIVRQMTEAKMKVGEDREVMWRQDRIDQVMKGVGAPAGGHWLLQSKGRVYTLIK